jgi:hypothetical protein
VGTNTEWGQLMANLSEDNGEETPLQVILFKDSAYSILNELVLTAFFDLCFHPY